MNSPLNTPAPPAGTPEYEVYAIKYGDHQRMRQENFIFKDPHDEATSIDFYVWVITGGGRTFVVDLGFEAEEAKARGRQLHRLPSEAVRLVGVDPATVEDIIISHLHYDHCGDISPFPKARFHLQESEMNYATGKSMTHQPLRNPYNVDYVVNMVRAVYDDRVNFVDGVSELAPGLSVHHIGGHTAGIQSVRVWTRKGWLVVASDATHFYDNMAIPNPFPIVCHVGHMLDGYDKLRAMAGGDVHRVIPGHDPQVMSLFPAASKELEGIAVRLDADPIGDLSKVWRQS